MLNIDSLQEGLVIDHIQAGKSMDIYKYLKLDRLDCSVAIIKNARSRHFGKKDIIKIEGALDLNLDILGFIDPNITVNVIKNGAIAEKMTLSLPQEVHGVVKCKNPRCITSIDDTVEQIFKLTDATTRRYRCVYCEQQFGNL